MIMSVRIFLFVCLLIISNSLSTETNWKLELEKEGIKVYTRITTSDFKEFKGEILINASITEIEKVLVDIEKYPDWCYKTRSATIIEKDSTTIRYFYVSDTPGFLKTRVACFELHREINHQTGEVIFFLNDILCTNALDKDMLLIPIMKGTWKLTPTGKGGVMVTMQMLTEPGGIIPSWLANLVVVDSPYETLSNLKKQIRLNKK